MIGDAFDLLRQHERLSGAGGGWEAHEIDNEENDHTALSNSGPCRHYQCPGDRDDGDASHPGLYGARYRRLHGRGEHIADVHAVSARRRYCSFHRCQFRQPTGNITSGRSRVFVVGKRSVEGNLTGNNSSRALQAATLYYFRISCPSDG